MPSTSDEGSRVTTQVFLVDPGALSVEWMNEAAAAAVADRGETAGAGLAVERALPVGATLGLSEALREVATSGVTRHLRADVVATSRRNLTLVVAIHRLPGGKLLLLAEHAVEAGRGRPGPGTRRRGPSDSGTWGGGRPERGSARRG